MYRIARKLAVYGWVAAGLSLAYVGVVLGNRYLENRRIEREARRREARARMRLRQAPVTGVQITQFYGSNGHIIRGEHVLICYGVENAEKLVLEPPIEQLRPHPNRCFPTTPRETTTYTLTAEGPAGRASATFTVEVHPPPAEADVAMSDREVKRGQPVTVCCVLKNAVSARIEPIGLSVAPSGQTCHRIYPVVTRDYTLVIKGEDGHVDRARFTIKVN